MNECKVQVVNVHSEFITELNVAEKLGHLDGLLVAPDLATGEWKGKIIAVKYSRENNLPFFGICLGMQMAVIEFAKNVLGLTEAHSTEMNPGTCDPVIDLMEDQKKVTAKGGTMRLGSYPCELRDGSLARSIYDGEAVINERHRHRWEFNNSYLEKFESAGMVASGKNPESNLVEIIELPSHPFFIGVQYHPELKSTVENPQPVFVNFIKAAKDYSELKNQVKNPALQSEMN
jgi:CTP synthase